VSTTSRVSSLLKVTVKELGEPKSESKIEAAVESRESRTANSSMGPFTLTSSVQAVQAIMSGKNSTTSTSDGGSDAAASRSAMDEDRIAVS